MFWQDTFSAYCSFAKQLDIETGEELLAEPIFYNEKFKIAGKVFYYNDWTKKNIYLVKDLTDDNGLFLDYKSFLEKYRIKVNYLNYLGCMKSVKQYMTKTNIKIKNKTCNLKTKALSILSSVLKGSRVYYNIMIEQIEILNIKPFINWEMKLKTAIDWHEVLKKIRKIKEIKLRWFQLRICFRILVTNTVLKEMRMVASDNCNFCERERDSIDHYLWDCPYVHSFWVDLEKRMKEKCENCVRLSLSKELILFGTDGNCTMDEVFELIMLFAKFFVYKCRFNKVKPTVHVFLKELQYKYRIEKHVHCLNMQYYEFQRKWIPYINLIDVY